MHRFYLPPEECEGDLLRLSERESHHAIHVLRMKRGDEAIVLDGAGTVFDCEVAEIGKRCLTVKVLKKTFREKLPDQITLVQAIPKGKAMEGIVQKATELGAHRIVPLISERTNVLLGEDTAAAKQEKWQLTAIEAVKQCGSPWITTVAEPVTLKSLLDRKEKFDLNLIASLESDSVHPRKAISDFVRNHNHIPNTTCVWIGPEGDFSPSEYLSARELGAVPISLGSLVLRSETAAIYCLSILNYEFEAAEHRTSARG